MTDSEYAQVGTRVLRTEVQDGDYQDTIPVGTPGTILDVIPGEPSPYNIKWDHDDNNPAFYYSSEEFEVVGFREAG